MIRIAYCGLPSKLNNHRRYYAFTEVVPKISILISVVTFFCRCSSSMPSTYISIERIAVGSSGGVTGYGRGYRIERNGTVDEWELRGGNTFIISTAKLPASSV